MSGSDSRDKNSVTEVAEESFVRARPSDIERGAVLASRYQVEDVIGKGGSGIVLRVFDRTAQNVVALKVLKSELALDSKWEKRFSRELRLGRPIQHPNVCRIFDIGEADGHRFLTMELAAGGSLRDELRLTRSEDRPIEQKIADAKMVVAGLAALHSAGVVHRDFKPDNLLRMADGRLVLSDFGLATDAANAGGTVLIGTPHYMAPEVLAGEPATSRSDVWALGVVLHEIFFGRRPERRSVSFDGSGRSPLRPSSVLERRMLALSERCLADAPLDRPSNAGVVAQMFGDSGLSRRAAFGRRPARLIVTAGVAALLGMVALGFRHRFTVPSKEAAPIHRLEPIGQPVDWSKTGRAIADVNGKVHCFSVANKNTLRVIWGSPRRAEDIDVVSGIRRSAELRPETYRAGCPQLAPDGKRLLFTAPNQTGSPEIRMSEVPDGSDSAALTSGSEPLWFGNGDQVAYNLGSGHVAIISLATMEMTLLPDPAFGDSRFLVGKAVSPKGDLIAAIFATSTFDFAVAIFQGPRFDTPKLYSIPMGSRLQFGSEDDLLLSYYTGSTSILADVDWRTGEARNIGRYSGFDLLAVGFAGAEKVVWARQQSSDAWLYEGGSRSRLTSDRRTYSVARSPVGELLLGRRDSDGNMNIWRQMPGGVPVQLTSGRGNVAPDYAPDGQSWVYANYDRKSIVRCSNENPTCRDLRRDDSMPTWPRFSPDGRNIAYVTQMGAPRVVIISAIDGSVRASWDAYYECPPIWSRAATIWSLEASGHRYWWAEREVERWTKTGHRIESPNENLTLEDVQCWPKDSRVDSPLFEAVRVESDETSRFLAAR
jgi:Protein kinase domain/WD40-like Beta Propeller Repeat